MRNEEQTTAANFWQGRKFRFRFFAPFLLLLTVFQSPVHCLESAGQIIQELDAQYYYPHKQGLKKLSVWIEWEQLDVFTGKGKYLKNPPVIFIWKTNPTGSKSIFKFAEDSATVSSERQKHLLNILENFKEIVIPKTLREKMAGHEGRVNFANKHNRVVEFESLDPDAGIRKYSLMVDLQQKNVSQFIMERNSAPFQVTSDIRYTTKNGKWLIAESRSSFRIGQREYHETTELVYRQVGTFWLVGKMTQTLEADDRILQSFIFRFRDYQVN